MPEPAPRSAILASPSVSQPGEVDRLNAILEDAGLGRPLGPPERSTPAVVVLPVSADPRAVVAALRRAAPEGGDHHYEVSSGYSVHTIVGDGENTQGPPPTVPLHAAGLKSGHGTATWKPVGQDKMKPRPQWTPPDPPPVVVVLDSGVRPHPWLPPQTTHPRFCVVAHPGRSYHLPVRDNALRTGNFGGYWGHATFLAGLIRLHAPDAQVLSLRLMRNDGTLRDYDVLSALDWLIHYLDNRGVADVVLMAFGRPKAPGEANPATLSQKIAELGCKGVKVVASAGNNGSDTKTIPACLAEDPGSPVVSVGAGRSAEHPDRYSNRGPWVHEWRPGRAVSLMPLTGPDGDGNGFARWSGTSFSAAIVAGELAQARAAERAASAGR